MLHVINSIKVITLNELYEMMAVMIEIGEGKDHKVYQLQLVSSQILITNVKGGSCQDHG